MATSTVEVLKTQGRGITGALLVVGVASLYTMETWWLGWRLPTIHLLLYALGGLLVVFVTTREVGFRGEAWHTPLERTAVDFAELVLQSVVTAALVLAVFGVVDADSTPLAVARLTLVQAVPLAFGASLANVLLTNDENGTAEPGFPRNLPLFALGAAFLTLPIAPTQEVVVIATYADPTRLAILIALSVAVVHVVLHEVGYREQAERIGERPVHLQIGLAFVVYVVSLVVATGLLLGFGQLTGAATFEAVRLVVGLSFPGAVGAAGAEVIL